MDVSRSPELPKAFTQALLSDGVSECDAVLSCTSKRAANKKLPDFRIEKSTQDWQASKQHNDETSMAGQPVFFFFFFFLSVPFCSHMYSGVYVPLEVTVCDEPKRVTYMQFTA